MTSQPRREEYIIGSDIYTKVYSKEGDVQFLKNDKTLDLMTWNQEINEFQSMSLKHHHGNPIVRWIDHNRRKGFLRFVDVKPSDIVADIGCETGYMSVELLKRGREIICVDIDSNLLEKARQRVGSQRASFVVSDIQDINLPSFSVDVAVASEILEHLPAPEKGIKEIIRITRPGGKVFISVPNDVLVLIVKRILRILRMTWILGRLNESLAIGHIHVFRKRDLIRLIQRENLMIERIKYHLPFYLNIFVQLRRFENEQDIKEN